MLAHACINVRNLDKTIAFYKKLGLKVVFSFKTKEGKRFGAYMKAGKGTFMEMFQLDSAEALKYVPNRNIHLCFQVKDLKEAERTVKKKGLKIVNRISWGEYGSLFFLNDPDGNQLEFLQYFRKNPLLKHMK